jgi:hypothetical protein
MHGILAKGSTLWLWDKVGNHISEDPKACNVFESGIPPELELKGDAVVNGATGQAIPNVGGSSSSFCPERFG